MTDDERRDFDVLLRRLQRLERREAVRSAWLPVIVVLVLAAVSALSAAQNPGEGRQTVRAEKIELVVGGRVEAVLSAVTGGLRIEDGRGHALGSVTEWLGGGLLSVFNARSQAVASLSTNREGNGTVDLRSREPAGPPRAARAAPPGLDAGPGLHVYNERGEDVGSLTSSVQASGTGQLNLRDANGRVSGGIGVNQFGGALLLYSREGLPQVEISSVSAGGQLSLLSGRTRLAGLGANEQGGNFDLFNRAGSVIMSVGTNLAGRGDLLLMNERGERAAWITTLRDGSSGAVELLEPASGKVLFKAPGGRP